MELMMDLAAIFASLNLALLVGLFYVYGRIAWRTRAPFSLGLLAFSVLLLLHNTLTVYSYLTMASFFGESVLPYLFTASALEFGGLAILLRFTLRGY